MMAFYYIYWGFFLVFLGLFYAGAVVESEDGITVHVFTIVSVVIVGSDVTVAKAMTFVIVSTFGTAATVAVFSPAFAIVIIVTVYMCIDTEGIILLLLLQLAIVFAFHDVAIDVIAAVAAVAAALLFFCFYTFLILC